MKKLIALILCAFALGTAAQTITAQEIIIKNSKRDKTIRAAGRTIKEEIDVTPFTGICVSGGINVEVNSGNRASVELKTDANMIDFIQFSVRRGVLHIHYDDNISVRNIKTTVYVTMRDLASLAVSSGADIRLSGSFGSNGGNLEVTASSAGSVSGGNLNYTTVKVTTSSGGIAKLDGKAVVCDVNSSSGGSAKLRDLKTKNVRVSASSGGTLSVYASESLTGSVSSGGSVGFAGNPRNMEVRKSSGGSVHSIR